MAKFKVTLVYVVEAESKREALTTLAPALDAIEYLEWQSITQLAEPVKPNGLNAWKQTLTSQLRGRREK